MRHVSVEDTIIAESDCRIEMFGPASNLSARTERDHAAEAANAGVQLLYPSHELAACVDVHARRLISEALRCGCRC